ncbi:hypothetical protein AAHE18_15G224100 [Arachis hypogaea]
MDDDSGLELSLGLSCGGSSGKSKNKNGSSSDIRAEDAGKSGKMVDDFKSMFDAGSQKPDSIAGARRSDSTKPEENFFSDLSKAKDDNASLNLNGGGFWAANSSKPIEIEDDNRLEAVNKRKMPFDDIRNQKKHGSDVHHANLHERARTSHLSITEDGSTAENEDVADSEAENSTSRPLTHHSDGSKGFIRVGASSDVTKGVRGIADSSATDFNGQKRFNGSSEKDFKHANMTYAPSPQRLMHVMPTAAGEAGGQAVSNGPPLHMNMTFGYPPFQLPMLDKDSSLGMVSRPQQLHTSFAGRGPPNSAGLHVIPSSISEAMPFEGRPLERSKGDGKLRVPEEGSSSHPEDVKGSSTNLRAKDVQDHKARSCRRCQIWWMWFIPKPALGIHHRIRSKWKDHFWCYIPIQY